MSVDSFKAKESSEKIILARIHPSTRLIGWEPYAGSIYSIDEVYESTIINLEDFGVALTRVSSIALVDAVNKWYYDQASGIIYLWAAGSVDPNTRYIVMNFTRYFSNAGVNIPHDLDSGYHVHWEPLVLKTSEFGIGLDQRFFGLAIEGTGSISFVNNRDYWAPIYEIFYWENKLCEVYLWNRELLYTEAILMFKGKISSKKWTDKEVSFSFKDILTELKAKIELTPLTELVASPDPIIGDSLTKAYQRVVLGKVNGHVPTPIDRINDGYALPGTVSATTSSLTLTGVGTSFLKHFSGGDQILVNGPNEEFELTVDTVNSDTSITLSEEFDEVSVSGVTYRILPEVKSLPYANRRHLVCGHATKEPVAMITAFLNFTNVYVDTTDDFEVGAEVFLNNQRLVIANVTGGNRLTFAQSLNVRPDNGDVVTRPSVFNVRVSDRLLLAARDYTYDADDAILVLDDLAEFNVAPTKAVIGTVTFTSASRSVTGSGTLFTTQFKVRDWIRADGQVDYFEILSIQSNTALTLRVASTYSESTSAKFRSPIYLNEEEDTVNLSVLGKTEDGTKTGTFLRNAPQIVKSLLVDVGLDDLLDDDSFDVSIARSHQTVGFVVPAEMDGTSSVTIKEVIEDLNKSVFSSLIQNNQFLLTYNLLEPDKATEIRANQSDVIKWTIESRSDQIFKEVELRYNVKEYDYLTAEDGFDRILEPSNIGLYLAKTNKVVQYDTRLVEEFDAELISKRYVFFTENSSSVIKFETKLQALEVEVNDKIEFDHPKLFSRVGSSDDNRIGLVQSFKKRANGVSIELEDLSGAMTRTASYAEPEAVEFSESSKQERVKTGYYTDENGLIDNKRKTFQINRYW